MVLETNIVTAAAPPVPSDKKKKSNPPRTLDRSAGALYLGVTATLAGSYGPKKKKKDKGGPKKPGKQKLTRELTQVTAQIEEID